MAPDFDRRNLAVVTVALVLALVLLLGAGVIVNAQNTDRDRERIEACSTVVGNLDRAICLGRQP